MIIVSFSEVDAYRQCQFKHQLDVIERWKKDDPRGALHKGTMWHVLMEIHYRGQLEGLNATDIDHEVVKQIARWRNAGEDKELVDLLQWMYEGYIAYYGLLDTDEWMPLAVEWRSVVPLDANFALGFTVDLVMFNRLTKKIWLWDHKSGKDLPTEKDLDFHEQFTLYTWALRQLGKPVFGSVHNAARTTRNKGDIYKPGDDGWKSTMKAQTLEQRFFRTFMTRTRKELDMAVDEFLQTCYQMYPHAASWGEQLPIIEKDRPRSFNADTCGWKCGFTEACLLGRKTGDNQRTRQMLSDTGFVRAEHGRYDDVPIASVPSDESK